MPLLMIIQKTIIITKKKYIETIFFTWRFFLCASLNSSFSSNVAD